MTDLVRSPTALTPAPSGHPGGLVGPEVSWTVDTEVWWSETGRIRMGYSTPSRSGRGKQPHRLDHYRLTSVRRDVISEVARLYGGQVTEWPATEAPYGIGQWQVTVEADWLHVQVPEVKAGSSQYELWGLPEGQPKGPPIRLRACNGEWDQVSGGGCVCLAEGVLAVAASDEGDGDPDEYVVEASGERACKRMTRLNLLLSEITDLGVWRLQTTGRTAGNQLVTFMRFWLPRLEPYTRLQLGITTVPRPYVDEHSQHRVALIHVPTLRADPASGKRAGDLLGGPIRVPPVVAEVAAAAAGPGAGATPLPPADDAGPGPDGHQPAAGGDQPPPRPEDYPTDADAPAEREAAAGTGRREPSTPAHPPGRPEDGPVAAACLNAGLSLGTARLYLVHQLAALFGPEHGQHPLHTISELATIPGDPQDRRSLAWAALDALRRQFTGMDWPPIPEGG